MNLMALAEKGFARLGRQYKQRKSLADSQVATWHWATKPVWDLNPLYFELHAERPGRNLRSKPAQLNRAFGYGTDASGRVVVERAYSEFGPLEKFYDWSKSPVAIAYFDRKKRINLELAKYSGDRMVQIATAATGGARLMTFHWQGSLLIKIEIRAAERSRHVLQKLMPYQEIHAQYDRDGQVKRVAIDWLPRPGHQLKRLREIVFERRNKPLVIDLQNDVRTVREMLEQCVRRYASRHANPKTAKQYPPLTRIDLHYSLGDSISSPWVSLCLNSAANAQPGDDYTHATFAMLSRKGWLPAVQEVCNGRKANMVIPGGKREKLGAGGLGRAIGTFLVSALLTARKDGVFSALPLAHGCELGVEDPTTGEFGWPSYRNRGKDNLVAPATGSRPGRTKGSQGSKPSRRPTRG